MSAPASAVPRALERDERFPTTSDGWALQLTRFVDRAAFRPELAPIVLVPGYGMNSFILGFHPGGTSLVHALCASGREVWCADLRGQGRSHRVDSGAPPPSLRRLAERDLPAACDAALEASESTAGRVDVLGCSLGGSLAFAYLALAPTPPVRRVVAIGSPLRWIATPGLLRAAFTSRRLAGAIRIAGTRRVAGLVFPLAGKLPGLLALYANAANIDLEEAATMVRTVEDPHPRMNRDIAAWVKHGDLVLRGVNVTEAMRRRREPLLLVAANRDGIVPEATALGPREVWGGPVSVLRVGTPERWYAHADLFVGREAPERVFAPIVSWLDRPE
ncbi:MAG TPA: alpha/beta fold hydrolase [Polyangiaceae bacterium LLY-WYZ-15_(1-7)]|nr:hypothetical protein [Myxococcales bacterium]MAT27557.1 hypothetical protein [Sandaracinus sp.]HJL06385.1 alpha/beta fold hydrolase [Polyangiaceae bacterium LLY-WYZ-15_(1-7)]MBJ74131.1 hypothetical protein [Sandaracinus sp.]HJL11314.1 alpha/beta fold hydrolase [Polyangiaceae bacterium LLY-WYZ-15_(1-7)]